MGFVVSQRVLSTYIVESRAFYYTNYNYGLGKCPPYGYLGPFGFGFKDHWLELGVLGGRARAWFGVWGLGFRV